MATIQNLFDEFNAKATSFQLELNNLSYASVDKLDSDITKNTLTEGLFLKAFIAIEKFLEEAFILSVTGGSSLAGFRPVSRLQNCSTDHVRAMIKGDQKYIDWSNPQKVRQRAMLFLVDGEPILSGVGPKSGVLSDIEKLRNMIAHDSADAEIGYVDLQIRILNARPLFKMPPGQFLRIRRKKKPYMIWASYYISEMSDVVHGIAHKSS